VSSLPKAVIWKRTGRDSNPRPFELRTNALPLRHTGHWGINKNRQYRNVYYVDRPGYPSSEALEFKDFQGPLQRLFKDLSKSTRIHTKRQWLFDRLDVTK